jgi:uncharacterized GH25 family protein
MLTRITAAATLLLAVAQGAAAHEFVAVATAPRAAAGAQLGVEVYSTHSLLNADELERTEINRVRFVHGTTRTEVALRGDEGRALQLGQAPAPTEATFIVSGHRLPLVFSTTPRGSQPGSKLDHPDAIRAQRTEKFSKALVNLSATDQGFAAVVGDRLEIVPAANPATLKVGDELPVRVLFEGQPLGTAVYATYQGFSTRGDTYALYTVAQADGTAHVRITAPGLWVVRVENRRQLAGNREIDADVTRATLAFHVN